jgi:tetratricopeptide (TPR) repeat protein
MNPSASRGAHSLRSWLKIGLGVGVAMGLLSGVGLWSLYGWIRDSAPSRAAQAFLREHPDVRADLGEDISLDGVLLGMFSESGERGSAAFTLPLIGTLGSGHAEVRLVKSAGQWQVQSAFYQGGDGVRRELVVREEETSKRAISGARTGDLNRYEIKMGKVQSLYKSGRLQEAIEKLNAMLEESPTRAEALYWRAQIRTQLGEYDAARDDIIRAVALNVEQREVYLLHDYLLARERRWEEIIQAWTQYLELHPDDDVALLERAGTWHHHGNDARALEDLERSCELGNAKACALHERQTGH